MKIAQIKVPSSSIEFVGNGILDNEICYVLSDSSTSQEMEASLLSLADCAVYVSVLCRNMGSWLLLPVSIICKLSQLMQASVFC